MTYGHLGRRIGGRSGGLWGGGGGGFLLGVGDSRELGFVNAAQLGRFPVCVAQMTSQMVVHTTTIRVRDDRPAAPSVEDTDPGVAGRDVGGTDAAPVPDLMVDEL